MKCLMRSSSTSPTGLEQEITNLQIEAWVTPTREATQAAWDQNGGSSSPVLLTTSCLPEARAAPSSA